MNVLCIAGFLGSGKTTVLLEVARAMTARARRARPPAPPARRRAAPALTGAVAGSAGKVLLTVNIIVFGVDEEALPAIVTDAWANASDADTVWPG